VPKLTRVSTFKMSRDVCQRIYPESGVKTTFHTCSHHAESPAKIEEFAKLLGLDPQAIDPGYPEED